MKDLGSNSPMITNYLKVPKSNVVPEPFRQTIHDFSSNILMSRFDIIIHH